LGFAGLFRGVDVCFARDIISGAVFFSCFAAAKHAVVDGMHLSPAEAQHAAFLTKLLAGAIAGVPSALLTTPLDVVKTRLQAQPGAESGSEAEGSKAYAGTWDCFVRTVEEEGWSALACGMGERVARLSPQLGITLALYEVLDPVRPWEHAQKLDTLKSIFTIMLLQAGVFSVGILRLWPPGLWI
jgi:solute carrier family 25 (mitochondrial aspartate/glutamate transporter), member 12/13